MVRITVNPVFIYFGDLCHLKKDVLLWFSGMLCVLFTEKTIFVGLAFIEKKCLHHPGSWYHKKLGCIFQRADQY